MLTDADPENGDVIPPFPAHAASATAAAPNIARVRNGRRSSAPAASGMDTKALGAIGQSAHSPLVPAPVACAGSYMRSAMTRVLRYSLRDVHEERARHERRCPQR